VDPLNTALGLAQIAPQAVRWLAGSNQREAAETLGEVAIAVTGHNTAEDALDMLKGDAVMGKEFVKALANRKVELDNLYLADRQDARRRELSSERAPWEMWTLAAAVVTGLLGIAGALFFVVPSPEAKDALLMIIGALMTRVSDVYGYYFGNNKANDEKSSAALRK
jgi:hypothetical protein